MNLPRINELKNLIYSLNRTLSRLRERKSNLEREAANTKNVQERIDYAVATAQRRVSELSSLGLRAEFLEEILRPVQNKPDCSGVGAVVKNEAAQAEAEIKQTQDKIWWANEEKRKLEMEDEVCPI